jgi:uncharacterized protein
MHSEVISLIVSLYDRIDQETAQFQAETGLHCPPGCGKCCENPDIETTVLEMMPVALELWRTGEASAYLERLSTLNGSEHCLFYHPDPFVSGNGRCSIYPWRPTLCRLFAFATVKNKQGNPELAACIRQKQTIPEQVEGAKNAIASGMNAPNFGEIANEVANLDPSLGSDRFPINQALEKALKRVGFLAHLSFGEQETDWVA